MSNIPNDVTINKTGAVYRVGVKETSRHSVESLQWS